MKVHRFELTDARNTALHRAAVRGHLSMVEHLVNVTGFDVKDKGKVCTVFPLRASWVHFLCQNIQSKPQSIFVSNDGHNSMHNLIMLSCQCINLYPNVYQVYV